MIQIAELVIEEFENGISVKWRDLERDNGHTKMVATEKDKMEVIGREIWGDIESVLQESQKDKVRLSITYEALDDQ